MQMFVIKPKSKEVTICLMNKMSRRGEKIMKQYKKRTSYFRMYAQQ